MLSLFTFVSFLLVGSQAACCIECQSPKLKYISVDHGFGHAPFCGETCLDPSKYKIFHIFERNLTQDNQTHPCAHQYAPDGRKYSHYNSTVTHGFPGLEVTLDLYSADVVRQEIGVCSICKEAVKGLVAAGAGSACSAACAATGCEPCVPYCASICGSIAAGETNAEAICAHIHLC